MNVYEIITSKIIEQLEQGTVPWKKTWATLPPVNIKSKKQYSGLNVLLLGTQGYASPFWGTYQQFLSLGGHVKKGEKSTLIVFWKVSDYSKKNQESGELENKESFLLRYYNVFNACQCDGLPDLTIGPNPQPIETCERIVKAMQNPPKFEQGHRASYAPQSDTVTLPAIGCFESPEAYHSVAFHEMTHSTAHASRLHREAFDNPVHFGSETYSKEELIAELGASMLCGQAGISPSVLENSASYLQSWISKLRGDSKLIVSAASAAQKAAKYIIGETAEESDTES